MPRNVRARRGSPKTSGPGHDGRQRERPTTVGERPNPDGAVAARNDAGFAGYVGAGPPPGHGPHRYVFAVHALDVEHTGADTSASPAYVGFTMFGHTLGRAVLTATFEQ